MSTVVFLSPARCGGERAAMLVRSEAELGARLRRGAATVGEVFSWLSALYFRGKLAYARAFAPHDAFVMAPGLGLVPPEHTIDADLLRAMGEVDVESERFVGPLRRDAEQLAARRGVRAVLLGSIATGKYSDTLLAAFGERLMFPGAFVGRGDMSRGGLLLRAARSGEELTYISVQGATVRGKRPPKLVNQLRSR